mmetsp:Transcript_14825/g.13030  ORF Transcript_14825/g.13030 Transcript_14825/m.13030 type:complete len:91 (-) Transcript_14825:128-400(-)
MATYAHGPFKNSPVLKGLGFATMYTPAGGSDDTINMHQFILSSDNLNSDKSANSKFIFHHGQETYFSIDTGESENVLSPHNFDLNERHVS